MDVSFSEPLALSDQLHAAVGQTYPRTPGPETGKLWSHVPSAQVYRTRTATVQHNLYTYLLWKSRNTLYVPICGMDGTQETSLTLA